MSAEGFDPANLAHWVLARRKELDLSHEDVADRGGPSTTKMSQIENKSETPPRRDVLKKLDVALEWRPGSARRVMLGGEPVALPPRSADVDELRRQILEANISQATKDALLASLDRESTDGRGVMGA